MKIFPTAEQARRGSRNNVTIHQEIRAIEEAILAAIQDGELSVQVKNSHMTSAETGESYYLAWDGPGEADRALVDQMNNVLIYFKDMGYSIIRKTNADIPTLFYWEVMW